MIGTFFFRVIIFKIIFNSGLHIHHSKIKNYVINRRKIHNLYKVNNTMLNNLEDNNIVRL